MSIRGIKRNILRNKYGNRGLKDIWAQYMTRRGIFRKSIIKRIKNKLKNMIKKSRKQNRRR
jgi:hypothetical protein